MATYTSPITTENLPQAWSLAAGKYYWAKKKHAIRNATVSVSQILYYFTFSILVYGVVYTMVDPLVTKYVSRLPTLVQWWEAFYALWYASAETEAQRLIQTALFLYGVPFVPSLVIAVLIAMLYHPILPKKSEDPVINSESLRTMAKHAQVFSQRKDPHTLGMCSVFLAIPLGILFYGLILFCMEQPSLNQAIVAQGTRIPLWILGLVIASLVAYRVINLPLWLILKLMSFCHVPKNLAADAEQYYLEMHQKPAGPAANNPQ